MPNKTPREVAQQTIKRFNDIKESYRGEDSIRKGDMEEILYTFANRAGDIARAVKTPAEYEHIMTPLVQATYEALGVQVAYDCDLCNDLGYTVTPAHQHGGEIVDEVEHPCICKAREDIEIDHYEA